MDHFRAGTTIDFLFTDIELPGSMSGLEFARLLQSSFPDLKMLVTSGRAPAQTAAFLAPFIPKPYDVHDVVARIRGALADLTPG